MIVRRAPAWGGPGLYAYPFTGYYPASYAHPLPYRNEELVALRPFDYAELGRRSMYAGTDFEKSAASGASAPRSAVKAAPR